MGSGGPLEPNLKTFYDEIQFGGKNTDYIFRLFIRPRLGRRGPSPLIGAWVLHKSKTIYKYNILYILYIPGDNVDCWMEIQHGKGPWAPPVSGIVPLGSTLTLVVAINDYRGKNTIIIYVQVFKNTFL